MSFAKDELFIFRHYGEDLAFSDRQAGSLLGKAVQMMLCLKIDFGNITQ